MKILHFADLHLGVENYGHLDPDTGLSTRLLDFLKALDQVVECAISKQVDLVLFCGDAYRTREPTQTQQREFAKRINKLSTAGIPIFLLVGNHDLPNAIGRATTTEIFDTLAVKNVYVSSKPQVYKIPTKSGTVQVASLPWPRRGALLSREDSKGLTLEELNRRLEAAMNKVIADMAGGLDPALPAILAGHVAVTDARIQAGSERTMAIGQEQALTLGAVARPEFDYVALGHVHRYQVLGNRPPVVYAGSLERVDFGEEKDDKGFCLVDIDPSAPPGQRFRTSEFIKTAGRRFLTISAEVDDGEDDATATVLKAVTAHRDEIKDNIVRLCVSVPEGPAERLREADIKDALKDAYYLTVSREVRREARLRLGTLSAEDVTPRDGLQKWLETQENLPAERRQQIAEYGERLIREQTTGQGAV